MTTKVMVKTTARLHMGFFDLNGGLGRKFGSIGLSLDAPSMLIKALPADYLVVTGAVGVPQAVVLKAKCIAEQLLAKLGLPSGVALKLETHIPTHAGLGSGTQLALAVGAAINQLHGLNLTTAQIAALTERGGRSGIGIAAFDLGGVIIDGGRAAEAEANVVPPLLARYAFPEDWAVLLILDHSQAGVHGAQEKMAFSELPAFSESVAARLCRHVLMQAMPALVERDLNAFGQAIKALQVEVGDYFAPVQGGRYASALVSKVLQQVAAAGVACYGQSSWGPTGFAIYESRQQAQAHLQVLRTQFKDEALGWQLCKGLNQGAEVSFT